MLVTLFGNAGSRAGVLGILRGSSPVPSDWKAGPPAGKLQTRVPGRLRYRAVNDAGDRLVIEIITDDVVATPQNPPVAKREVFLQIRGRYTVSGTVGGRPVSFSTPGFAETFVRAQTVP
jgi:hypothetical protein